jgi:hypothetical protein
MPRKPTKPDDPAQSKRFIEAAEEVGADDDNALAHALGKVSKLRTVPSPLQRDTKTKKNQSNR